MNRAARRRAEKGAVKAAKASPALIDRLVTLYWDPKRWRWNFDKAGPGTLTITDKWNRERRTYNV